MIFRIVAAFGLVCVAVGVCFAAGADDVDVYSVVWESPSGGSSGSMPIGNGDIGLNVWVERNGDCVFYISKTDAWSENAQLLKLGMVRVSLRPSPFAEEMGFRQALVLSRGMIEISGGQGDSRVVMRVWVDASRPVIRVEAEGRRAFEMDAELVVWRTETRELTGEEAGSVRGLTRNPKNDYPIMAYPDVVLPARNGRVRWYHRNEHSCYGVTLENQHLGSLIDRYPDSLMGRTFGGEMAGEGMAAVNDRTLQSVKPGKRFCVSIHALTAQTDSAQGWVERLDEQVSDAEKVSVERARAAHERWWRDFWNRSWIRVSGSVGSSQITTNDLPLRIGADSNGGNRFAGYMASVQVFGRALSGEDIAAMANGGEIKEEPAGGWAVGDAGVRSLVDGGPEAKVVGELGAAEHGGRKCLQFDGKGYLEVADEGGLDFEAGCTLAAWVAPEKLAGGGGRIIDKSRAGTANGYLLDTHPGNSLRLIVEAGTLSHDAKLEPGKWVFVAGTYDSAKGVSRLYVDGKEVAAQGADNDGEVVTRGYVLQRWINACAGRGACPIKFNGSIFTVDAQVGSAHFDADYRRWGGMYWWQNTRLPYWSMLSSGDFDLMRPLFAMYTGVLGLCRDKTQLYYEHGGAFFPETMYFWGTNGNCDYGWGHPGPETENGYIRREWQGGIEVTAMMLDYYDHTRDDVFLRETLLPVADAVTTFYDEHWGRGDDGKIRFEPSQALETWWECVNPTPEVAGLHYVVRRLLELGEDSITPEMRRRWKGLLDDLPEVAEGSEDGKRYVKAAEVFGARHNSENPELYAVWPYPLYGVTEGNVEIALETWKRRLVKGSMGWRQDAIQAACMGLSEEAARYVAGNFSTWDKGSRFPAFWGPNFDWIPDQDHGSVACTALQRMLLQYRGDEILLLPAWPKGWDVDFRLHGPEGTIVEGSVTEGQVGRLKVSPKSRRGKVKLVSLGNIEQ